MAAARLNMLLYNVNRTRLLSAHQRQFIVKTFKDAQARNINNSYEIFSQTEPCNCYVLEEDTSKDCSTGSRNGDLTDNSLRCCLFVFPLLLNSFRKDLTPKLRRRRQRERQKSNWFNEQNNNLARASRFFCTFLCSPHNYQPPTQAFLGELVFLPSPQTPAQRKTTFLSHCFNCVVGDQSTIVQ